MGLPNIMIEFHGKAGTAIKRGDRGVVAIIVKETEASIKTFGSSAEVDGYTAENKAYIQRTFLGGMNPIKSVVVIASDTIENALLKVEKLKYDYLVGTPDLTSEEATLISGFIKGLRDNKRIKVKAVLPNIKADHEGIINFTTDSIVVGDDTFTSAQYCSRIAGLIAGTPLKISATYFVLPEVVDVPKFSKTDLDSKIDNGEFVIFHDGEKVKVGRAVTSLTTIAGSKTKDYKSIKKVDTMDLIYKDIKMAIEDNYIGKFSNNYDNKCSLIVAITVYLEGLRSQGLLDKNIKVKIDMEAQTAYLKVNGYDTENMNEQEIKEANTGSTVFLDATFKILDAIEDVSMNFYM